MPIKLGHVLALNLPFANGAPCKYKRPFLVIDKNSSTLDLLNIASVKGKERKLLFPSNELIKVFNPPLDQPSFIQKDELYTISRFYDLNKSIYKRRPPLHHKELERLIEAYMVYQAKNRVTHVEYAEHKVREINFL